MLGITQGKKVTIKLRGDKIEVMPQGDWEGVLAVGEKMRADLHERGLTVKDIATLRAEADKLHAGEARKRYGLS